MQKFFSNPQRDDRHIAFWLIVLAIMIYCMVVLGGVTRLTGSGLSIVEWQPIMGAIPPLNESQWLKAFAQYQQSPQYQQVNQGMLLSEFKWIFAFEYAHRLLGRLIGIAFALPFLYFLFQHKIRRGLIPKLILLFLLGGLQGFIGWYMVQSGLINEPRVSQYRLALHLSMAILIYGVILWTAWSLLQPNPRQTWKHEMLSLRRFSLIVTTTVAIMIISGAFVAGTHAGKVFNTFPLMDGQFIPTGMFALEPFYRNFFENLATVQFNHRLLAYLLMLMIPGLWFYARRFSLAPQTRFASHVLLTVFILQLGLGIATLLNYVPIALGAAHQGGAVLLLTLTLYFNHSLRRSTSF